MQAIAEGLLTSGTVPPALLMASAATDRTRGWWETRSATDNRQLTIDY